MEAKNLWHTHEDTLHRTLSAARPAHCAALPRHVGSHLVHMAGQLLRLAFERLRLLAVPLLEGVELLLDGVQVDLHLQLRVSAARLTRAGPGPQQVMHPALQLFKHLLKQPSLRERRATGQVTGSQIRGHVRSVIPEMGGICSGQDWAAQGIPGQISLQ